MFAPYIPGFKNALKRPFGLFKHVSVYIRRAKNAGNVIPYEQNLYPRKTVQSLSFVMCIGVLSNTNKRARHGKQTTPRDILF